MKRIFEDIESFGKSLKLKTLRPYQLLPAQAILAAIEAKSGGKFGLVFSRQSGKDELIAQLIAYLLVRHEDQGGQIVMAAPTKRQVDISRQRLLARLQNWEGVKNSDYIVRVGKAEARFLSAAPSANARGETASLLLLANEAQDIVPARWDAVFDPMAASTNAVTLFMGTPFTAKSLLARETRFLQLNLPDNLFKVDWRQVAAVLPAYGKRVEERIAQFGREHPYIRTEYFLEEIGQDGMLFNSARQEAMQGTHPRQFQPVKGKMYALLVDVAGEDEATTRLDEPASRRDSTVASIVEIENGRHEFLSALNQNPVYKLVQRQIWRGERHTNLFAQLVDIFRRWDCRYCVVDATGIGAGLASFLARAIGEKKVLPFLFTSKSKSDLGWHFLSVVDTGRFKHYADDGAEDTRLFWEQVRACEHDVRLGSSHIIRWGVPNPHLHDDLLISAAMCALLDDVDWQVRTARVIG